MIKITLVQFRAYNQDCKEVFLNKTPEEIHEVLMDICTTHIVTAIMEFKDYEFIAVSTLSQFKRSEKENYI